jgi:hypothetical protein
LWKNCRKSWEIWEENCRSFDKTYKKLSQIAGISCNYRRSGILVYALENLKKIKKIFFQLKISSIAFKSKFWSNHQLHSEQFPKNHQFWHAKFGTTTKLYHFQQPMSGCSKNKGTHYNCPSSSFPRTELHIALWMFSPSIVNLWVLCNRLFLVEISGNPRHSQNISKNLKYLHRWI